MRTVLPVALIVAIALTVSPAAASCWSTSNATVMIGSGQPFSFTVYLVVDVLSCGSSLCLGYAGLYQETNGAAMLQRGDWVRNDVTGCGGQIDADRAVL